MKKYQIVTKPIRRADLTLDDLYGSDSDEWEAKAARLQARRWRKIKHQLV